MSSNFHLPEKRRRSPPGGFTLIELMIVIAVIAIILTLALPVYQDYSIRAKVGEGLAVAANAKTATADTCQIEPDLVGLTSARAGYGFGGSTYIESIEISGSCAQPLITITTRDTGTTPSPVLLLIGDGSVGSGRFAWTCQISVGQNIHVPMTCRS